MEILRPGLGQLEELTGKRVLGVVPMMNVGIDDEDSLSARLGRRGKVGMVDIAVVCLPRLSNYTDFNPLERLEQVTLRYIHSPREFGEPDLVILPGTKKTMDDLRWLRESGMEAKLLKHAGSGGAVLGICAGDRCTGGLCECDREQKTAGVGSRRAYCGPGAKRRLQYCRHRLRCYALYDIQ